MKTKTIIIILFAMIAVIGIIFQSCKKEKTSETTILVPTTGTFVDPRDGQIYATVNIGNQTWFAENLNYETVNSWRYDNICSNGNIYGRLYTWNAALTACPCGWSLPTYQEWTELITYLGEKKIAGGKMKETGIAHWWSPNTGATNSSCFTALPGGLRYSNGSFLYLGHRGYWWSSSWNFGSDALYQRLSYDHHQVECHYHYITSALSVRCLKD